MPVATIQYPDDIVNRNNNMGWHRNGKRAYRKAVEGILRFLQTAKEPRLYHLCFEPLADDISHLTSRDMYKANMAMLHALVQMAERKGIRCEWWAAREVADRTKKDHVHVFMVIDAKGIRVAELFNQFEDGRVQQHCKAHGVKFAIFRPKDMDGIHGNNRYMALPYLGPDNRATAEARERLADALVWCSYLGKARSKPEDDKSGQIFPASRPTRKAASAVTAPFLLSVNRLEGEIELTEKDVQHESSSSTSNGPGQTHTSPGTKGPGSGPYSSPSGPFLVSSRPWSIQDIQSSSSGPEAEAIRPRRQDGGPTDEVDSKVFLLIFRFKAAELQSCTDTGTPFHHVYSSKGSDPLRYTSACRSLQ